MRGLWKSEDGRVLINITDVREGLESHKIIQFEVIKGLLEKDCYDTFGTLYMVSVMPKYAVRFCLSRRVFRYGFTTIETTIHPHYIPLFNQRVFRNLLKCATLKVEVPETHGKIKKKTKEQFQCSIF